MRVRVCVCPSPPICAHGVAHSRSFVSQATASVVDARGFTGVGQPRVSPPPAPSPSSPLLPGELEAKSLEVCSLCSADATCDSALSASTMPVRLLADCCPNHCVFPRCSGLFMLPTLDALAVREMCSVSLLGVLVPLSTLMLGFLLQSAVPWLLAPPCAWG